MSIRALPFSVFIVVAAGLVACDKAEQLQDQEQVQVQKVTYVDDVEPILQKYCATCHVAGQQGAEETGLLMDSYASLMKGTRSGPIIKPGSASVSSLYILMTGKGNLTVNMPHGKDPLSAEEIETIRVWIDSGAVEN